LIVSIIGTTFTLSPNIIGKRTDYKEILFQNTKYLYLQRHISDIFQTSFETLKTSCQAPKILCLFVISIFNEESIKKELLALPFSCTQRNNFQVNNINIMIRDFFLLTYFLRVVLLFSSWKVSK
jgi:hypothetical protein